jgi:hypothetical protein
MTYKNHEVKIVEHQEISQMKKGHWVFYETARQRTLLGKMSFRNVATCDLYAVCGPSAPIQTQVMQCAHSGVSPRTLLIAAPCMEGEYSVKLCFLRVSRQFPHEKLLLSFST